MRSSADIERRALDLLEQLLDGPQAHDFVEELLADEPEAVRTRVQALRFAMTQAPDLLPTLLPGGGEAGDPRQR